MRIMTIDPSFKAAAFSVYDGCGTIYIDNCTTNLGSEIGFEKIFQACQEVEGQFLSKIQSIGVGNSILLDKIASEVPPPVGNFAAGLYALDTMLLRTLWERYQTVQDVFIFSPSYLGTVHGTSKYKKSDSTKLAKYFIENILKDDFEIVLPDTITASGKKRKGTLNNDRAESFLFMLRMFCKYDIKGYKDRIMSEMKGLGYEGEKLLCTR